MNNSVSQSHCIDSKQFTLFEVMRSLFLLGFFVFFATLQSSLSFHLRDCGYGFVLKEGNVVGRGFKNWDNYTHAKSVVNYDNCIYKRKSINITYIGVQRLAPVREGVSVTSSVRERRGAIWTRNRSPQILEVTLGTTSSAKGHGPWAPLCLLELAVIIARATYLWANIYVILPL